MKKIYLSLTILAVTSAAFAQRAVVTKEAAPFTNFTKNNIKPAQQSNGVEKAGGVVLWSNDFSNASDWTINNDGQTAPGFGWRIGTGAENSWWATTTVNSVSDGAYAELNNGNPTANPATQALDVTYTMTTSAPINVITASANTNNTDQVSLSYMQYGARFNDAQEVYISTNGTTWTLVDDNSDKSVLSSTGGSAYTNPTTEVINIAPFITGNATTVWIRFQWTTAFPASATNANVWVTYGWFIDDVAIITNSDNDVTISSPLYGAGTFQYPYTITAFSQVAPITFSAKVTNNGAAAQPGTKVDIVVGSTTYSSNAVTLPVGGTDSLVATTNLTPAAATATFTANYSASATATDENPSDNTASKTFHVAQFAYARDEAGLLGTSATGSITNFQSNAGQPFKIGGIFEIMGAGTIYGAQVVLRGTIPTGGGLLYAEIYKFNGTDYIFQSGTQDLNITGASQTNKLLYLPFITPLVVAPTDDILIVAGHYGSELPIASAGAAIDGSVVGFDGTGTLFGLANPVNPCVRISFDQNLFIAAGISEVVNNGIVLGQNTPNPFNADSRINFEIPSASNVSFTITDITGKIVETIQMGNLNAGTHILELNASNYNSGVYFYTITVDQNQLTNRMVIQK
jgi:hypothetical protein